MSSFKEKITYWALPLLIVILFLILIQLAVKTNPLDTSDSENPESPIISDTQNTNRINPANATPEDNQAILHEAILNQKLSLCSSIQDKVLKTQCEDQLNHSQALQTKNLNNCDRLHDSGLKRECYDSVYFFLATNESDKKLCEKIEDVILQSECFNRIEIILVKEDSLDCNNVQGASAKKICLDKLELIVAINEGNLQGCQSVEDPVSREKCEKTVIHNHQVTQTARVNNQNIPDTNQEKLIACAKLAPALAEECKNKVNFDLAFEELDLNAYCNKISSPQKRQECFTRQGDKIDKFYFNKAISDKDQNACGSVANLSLRQLCNRTINDQI